MRQINTIIADIIVKKFMFSIINYGTNSMNYLTIYFRLFMLMAVCYHWKILTINKV